MMDPIIFEAEKIKGKTVERAALYVGNGLDVFYVLFTDGSYLEIGAPDGISVTFGTAEEREILPRGVIG